MDYNKKGFTLIELLVVVLIIGILAAIALPQYQVAVNKSRYAGLMPLARSVKDAEEAMFMTKNDYTATLEDLSIKVPGTISPENTASDGKVTIEVVAGAGEGQDYVKAVDSRNTANTYVMYFAKSPRYPGEIHCEALTSDLKAQQLCKSYGPVGTVTGTDGTFTAYVIQGSGEDAGSSSGTNSNNDNNGPLNWSTLTCIYNDMEETTECFNEQNAVFFAYDCSGDGTNLSLCQSASYGVTTEDGRNFQRNCTLENGVCSEYTSGRDNWTTEDGVYHHRICSSVSDDGTCDGYVPYYDHNMEDSYDRGQVNGWSFKANCSAFNTDGSCSAYSSASYSKTITGGSLERSCQDVNSDASCNTYSGGWDYYDEYPNPEGNGTIAATYSCSAFSGDGSCTAYSHMEQIWWNEDEGIYGESRHCEQITGTTCSQWSAEFH